jgi:hypothetical protein
MKIVIAAPVVKTPTALLQAIKKPAAPVTRKNQAAAPTATGENTVIATTHVTTRAGARSATKKRKRAKEDDGNAERDAERDTRRYTRSMTK